MERILLTFSRFCFKTRAVLPPLSLLSRLEGEGDRPVPQIFLGVRKAPEKGGREAGVLPENILEVDLPGN